MDKKKEKKPQEKKQGYEKPVLTKYKKINTWISTAIAQGPAVGVV